MESNQKKNVFLVGTICVLAVLAVTMMIGTKNQWWGNQYPPKKVNQGRICSDYLMVIHLSQNTSLYYIAQLLCLFIFRL